MLPRFYVFVALGLAVRQAAGAGNFRGTGNVSQQEVGDVLLKESADAFHHLAKYEDALRNLFTSLPKNARGNLGHETVRYALRRYFMNRYGWLISGLEADSSSGGSMPDTILATLERHTGKDSVDLRGLATLVAALEDILDGNSQERLRSAYDATFDEQELRPKLSHKEAADVMETYVMMALSPTSWRIKDRVDLKKKKRFFREHQKDNFERVTQLLYRPMQERYLGSDESTAEVAMESLSDMAKDIDHDFHIFFDKDCQAMKAQLAQGQGKRAGRVRLAAFYNMSLYGDWSFAEKESYLRAAGALDDSSPPHVIIANYALGRLNCLNETALYSVCCRNTCEDLLTQLEEKIGGSATAASIAELVATMSSESIEAPGVLPESLLLRLDEVAEHHGGKVPIHGRLFAQWMHHVFPLECPYPHYGGTSSQSVEQWLVEMGEATHELSVEEIQQQVEADVCIVKDGSVDCGEESADLPWTMTEELLAPSVDVEQSSEPLFEFALLFLAAALVLGAPLIRSSIAANYSFGFMNKSTDLQNRAIVVVVLLATSAYLADFLDSLIFGAALASCSIAVVARLASQRLGRHALLPMAKVV